MSYRILSMDGGHGGQTGAFLSGIERRAESLGKSFLSNADLFAGTSAGGVNAMLLAWLDEPLMALEAILRFEDDVSARGPGSPFAMAGALFGASALLGQDEIKSFCKDTFGEAAILADLKKPVLVTAFQLDSADEHAAQAAENGTTASKRRWSAKTFTNLPGDPSGSELIVDVVLRTMAMPIAYPIHQSVTGIGPAFVDGAVFANNPAMMAVARCMDFKKLDDLSVLSLGNPRNLAGSSTHLDPGLRDGVADWGYRQWMFDPLNPLLLADVFVQAGVDAVNYQCAQILGSRYLRIEPEVFEGAFWDQPDMTTSFDAQIEALTSMSWFKAAAKSSKKASAASASEPEKVPAH